MGAGVVQKTGEPPGEPPDGAGSLDFVELESEDKSAISQIVKTEMVVAGVLV